MYLEEIIEYVKLESDKFEAKGVLNRENVVGWLKSIAGFVNTSGGKFYIGVEDKTNKLIGFDRKNADDERNYFNNQVNEHLTHRPAMKYSFVRYEINGKNKKVLCRKKRGICLIKPVVNITNENYRYLQFLDILENRMNVTIENENYREVLRNHILRFDLSFEGLIGYARFYNNQNVFMKLSELATGVSV